MLALILITEHYHLMINKIFNVAVPTYEGWINMKKDNEEVDALSLFWIMLSYQPLRRRKCHYYIKIKYEELIPLKKV